MWKSHCFKWYFTNNTTLQNNFKACWSEKPGSKNVTFYTCIIAVPTYSQKYLNRNRRKSWLYPSGSISSNQFQAPKVEIQIVSLPLLVSSNRDFFFLSKISVPKEKQWGCHWHREDGRAKTRWGKKDREHAVHVWWLLKPWVRNFQFIFYTVLSNILNKKLWNTHGQILL